MLTCFNHGTKLDLTQSELIKPLLGYCYLLVK